jgi:hypothetical protein
VSSAARSRPTTDANDGRGGRKKGSKNKRTIATEKAIEQAAAKLAEAIPDFFDGDAYLMAIYKDPSKPDQLRIDAAGKALPYEKPRLQATTMTGKDGGPAIITVGWKEPGNCERWSHVDRGWSTDLRFVFRYA